MPKDNTAVFIGHSDVCGLSQILLKDVIVKLIKEGVTDFLSGGQGEFDRVCAYLGRSSQNLSIGNKRES